MCGWNPLKRSSLDATCWPFFLRFCYLPSFVGKCIHNGWNKLLWVPCNNSSIHPPQLWYVIFCWDRGDRRALFSQSVALFCQDKGVPACQWPIDGQIMKGVSRTKDKRIKGRPTPINERKVKVSAAANGPLIINVSARQKGNLTWETIISNHPSIDI